MNISDIISGRAGVEGIQWALLGAPMRRVLRRELGALLPDAGMLGPCRLRRAKYKPGRHLTAYYDVTILGGRSDGNSVRPIEVTWRPPGAEDPRGPVPEMLAMQSEVQAAGLSAPFLMLTSEAPDSSMLIQVSPLDVSFPQLLRASTPQHVSEMLATAYTMGNGVLTPQLAPGYTVTPIRYRPRQRHVLRYDPQTASVRDRSLGPGTVFAKLYRGDKGVRALRIATTVADWLHASKAPISAARPLAYLPDEAVVLYPLVAGSPLSGYLRRPVQQVARHLSDTGSALRALHSAPEELTADLELHDFATEAKAISRACEHIRVLLPGAGALVDSILDRVAELQRILPQQPATFAHGDLKADHLWVTPSGLVLIDFDTCYLADPAIDVGKFLADLKWWYSEYDVPGVERAQQLFLEGYSGVGITNPTDLIARARLYEALVLVKITARRVLLFRRDWAAKTEHLLKHAELV